MGGRHLTKLLLEKTKESIMSVLPISLLIVVLNFIVFFVTKEFLFSKWIFIGFLIGSVFPIYPGNPVGWEIPLSIITFTLGAVIIYMVSKVGEKNNASQ